MFKCLMNLQEYFVEWDDKNEKNYQKHGIYFEDAARESGLYIEHVPNYYSIKEDPGKIFMRGLRNALEGDGFKFFSE